MLGGIVSSKLANRWRAGLLDKLCLHRVCAAVLLVFACAVQHCTNIHRDRDRDRHTHNVYIHTLSHTD
jgi:hypothetical protein